jgi:hypothetical protein
MPKRKQRMIVEWPMRRPDPEQMSLLQPLIEAAAGGDLTIQERFERFHAANPQVYRALREMALGLKARGHERIGVKMLWEALRYRYMAEGVSPVGGDVYRLNNIYTSRYARLLAAEPGLRGLFEMRELKAE